MIPSKPTALAVGAGRGCLDIFTLLYPFSPLSTSLWETARYRLKYCLKGSLNPKKNNLQNLLDSFSFSCSFYGYYPDNCDKLLRNLAAKSGFSNDRSDAQLQNLKCPFF